MSSPAIQTAATSAAQSSSPATLAFTTQNTTAGSLLCGVIRYNTTGTLGAISDNQNAGNYTVVPLGTALAESVAFFYMLNTAGGSKPTISCVLTGTVVGVDIAIAEYPLSAAASLRTSNTLSGGSSTNPTTSAVSPAVGDLLIAAFGDSQGMVTSNLSAGTCGASATLHPGGTTTAGTLAVLEDGIASSAASQTASLTYGTSTGYAAGLFAFAPPASGGGGSNWLSPQLRSCMRGARH